ncbi:MAG: hypothetical protein ACM30G_01905 [Micromonosporaceae bacterium]
MPDLDADLAFLVTDLHARAAAAAWPEPPQIRHRGDRRTARRRLAVAAAALAAVAAIVAVSTSPIVRREPVQPTPSNTAPSGPPAPVSLLGLATVHHADDVSAVAAGAGSIWLAFGAGPLLPGGTPGELVRLDSATLKPLGSWSIAGSPSAIAVTDTSVWVAGDVADARPVSVGADQVVEYDLDGHVRHTYPVVSPMSLAADGSAVWVQHGATGDDRAQLTRLHDGVADPAIALMASLPQRGQPLRVCPGGVVVASQNHTAPTTYVQRVADGRSVDIGWAPATGFVTLGCGAEGAVLVLTPDPCAAYRVRFPGGILTRALTLPPFTSGQAVAGSLAWLSTIDNANHTTVIWPIDTNTWISGTSIALPGDFSVAVADGNRVWTVGADPNQPGQTLVAALSSE